MARSYMLFPIPQEITWEGPSAKVPEGLFEHLEQAEYPVRSSPPGVNISVETGFASQGYALSVTPAGIHLAAGDDQGIWWGVMTLRQLLMQAESGYIQSVSIEDYPDIPARGFLLDISRNRIPKMETLYQLIDLLALLKMNQLQLYMEHTFAYRDHQEVWKDATPLTSREVQKIDSYCSRRGIELVPNQNCFGHLERWLKHPQYQHLAECPEGFIDPWGVRRPCGSCLSPAVDASLPFVGSLLEELLENFSSCQVNIGGDEPWELCQGRSSSLCREKGTGEVYLDFIRGIEKEAEKQGSSIQLFGDIITKYPEVAGRVSDEAIVIDWGYEAGHPFDKETELFSRQKKQFYLCCGTSAWNSFGGRWENAKQNIDEAANYAYESGAKGLLLTEWGDNGHLQQLPIMLPGIMHASAVAWRRIPIDDAAIVEAAEAVKPFGVNGETMAVILRLGNCYLKEPVRLHNAVVTAAWFLSPVLPYYRKKLRECSGRSLRPLFEEISRIRQSIDSLPESIIKKEIECTALFMEHACRSASYDLNGRKANDVPLPLLGTHDVLIELFRLLWNQRCRKGGLQESLGILEAVRPKIERSFA